MSVIGTMLCMVGLGFNQQSGGAVSSISQRNRDECRTASQNKQKCRGASRSIQRLDRNQAHAGISTEHQFVVMDRRG